MRSGISANKNTLQTQVNQISSIPSIASIIIQLPSQFYQNSLQEQSTPHILNNTNLHLTPSPNTNYNLPSISEFFNNLDQKYNCDNVYSKFIDAFLEEEITVNVIKDLSDEQLQKLGVVKIGWQKNIKQVV